MIENQSGMTKGHEAFGAPGDPSMWSGGAKDGVGTAYSSASTLWFTIRRGIGTEVYYPTVDSPQVRDLQFLFCDRETLNHEEELHESIEPIRGSLGYLIKGKGASYSYEKETICDPHLPCLLHRVRIAALPETLQKLKVYALCAPRLAGSGHANNAEVFPFLGGHVLLAHAGGIWLAMAADRGFSKLSTGYIGKSDGWTDLHQHHSMEWQFDSAPCGNVALTGEITLADTAEFVLGVAFGRSRHYALASLMQSLSMSYDQHKATFIEQWTRIEDGVEDLASASSDGGALYHSSLRMLLAHEDKANPGALIASLAIPWGEAKTDQEGQGGYHLVWTRDMVQSAMGLLAAGKKETPLRALIYLAATQREDGSFFQNFWVGDEPFWKGLQLDEVAFPILLAHRLWKESALERFRATALLLRAVQFLLAQGPITQQERWEEASGFSPSTLAVVIAAFICSADAARFLNRVDTAIFLEQYADWIERNLERWTVTHSSTLVAGITSHYVRLTPAKTGDAPPENGVTDEVLELTSRYPGAQSCFPAKDIVDAGFLELVRYGIRAPDDPIIVESVKAVDALLKAETASGTSWRRYNNDGYGQAEDGSPYVGHGTGRAWPLLTGERGHYELAAGRDVTALIRSMETLATSTQLLPEQSWDAPDTADGKQRNGRPTGSAVPLAWAHAEYIKLLRSARDGKVYDLIPEVAQRYRAPRPPGPYVEFWSFSCPIGRVEPGSIVRIIAQAKFELRFSLDEWATYQQESSKETKLSVYFLDVVVPEQSPGSFRFTFFWPEATNWENRDFQIQF